MKVAFWGTFDLGKPRNRILLRGLQENGAEVLLCHRQVWTGVEDKNRLTAGQRLRFLLRWLAAYPGLIVRYLRLPRHDAVLVGYLGQLDVLVLWPFARLRRVPVVWDAFLSLHDTVVDDRALVSPRHPLARLLFAWEWLAGRAADRVLLDTRAHAEAFARTFRLPAERMGAVLVGVEPEAFPLAQSSPTPSQPASPGPSPPNPLSHTPSHPPGRGGTAEPSPPAPLPQAGEGRKAEGGGSPSPGRGEGVWERGSGGEGPARSAALPSDQGEDCVRVLFYGQLIPLHGVETILRAARLARDEPFEWVLIGQGQEEDKVQRMLDEEALPRLRWIPWVPYEELARWIGASDVCLGIFGTSGKAARVIPNKVFQVLASGKPLVTRDGPAIRELLSEGPGLYLIPPGDPEALLKALRRFRAERADLPGKALHMEVRERIVPRAIGGELLAILGGAG